MDARAKKRILWLVTAGLLLIVAAVCGRRVADQYFEPRTLSEAELLDACEATFRHQFENSESGLRQSARAYYLEIEETDPSAEFLARFDGHRPPVRPGSEFQPGEGLLLRVTSVRTTLGGAVVDGGYYEGNLSASWNVYTLRKKDGKWTVVGDELKAIS